MNREDYYKNLENIIKQMLTPLRDIPFNLVIEAISGKSVLPFEKDNPKDIQLLNELINVSFETCNNVNIRGIRRPRPNEVGNDIEPFVRSALINFGFRSKIPKTKTGKQKSTGYPDIEFLDKDNRTCYLECKTYNIENIDTTQRSFYLSPSEDFKVNHDALHFIMSFEIVTTDREGQLNIYKTKSWKILDAFHLLCDVKYEFNSDNRRMYDKALILAEGNV